MKGVVLVSHGLLAEGMLDAVKMFTGEPEQVIALGLNPGEDIAEFVDRIRQAVDEVDTGDGATIFCDLLYGSPCNCAGALMRDRALADRIEILAGANLPMVIEYVTARDEGDGIGGILQIGRDGIVNYGAMLRELAGVEG